MTMSGAGAWNVGRDAVSDWCAPVRGRWLLDGCGLLLAAGLVFFNEANFRRTDSFQFSVDWQVLLRLCLLAVAGVYGLWHLPLVWKQLVRFPAAWFMLLAGWSLMTIPLAVNPLHATAAAGMLWCSLLFVPTVLGRLGPRRTLTTFLATLAALLVASWFVYCVFPEFGRDQYQVSDEAEGEYRLGGLAHPNGTGVQSAWVLILALGLWGRGWISGKLFLAAMLLGGVSLWATDCRTATFSVVAAAGLFAWRHSRSTALWYLAGSALLLAGLGLLLGVGGEGLFATLSRTGEAHEVYELNGRTDLWPRVLAKAAESPVVGFGHGCQRFVLPQLGIEWANYHAHNMLLHVLLGLGVVGATLLAMSLLQMLGWLVARPADFPDMVTLFLLLGGVADSMIFSPVPDATSFIWIMALCWPRASDGPVGALRSSLPSPAAPGAPGGCGGEVTG